MTRIICGNDLTTLHAAKTLISLRGTTCGQVRGGVNRSVHDRRRRLLRLEGASVVVRQHMTGSQIRKGCQGDRCAWCGRGVTVLGVLLHRCRVPTWVIPPTLPGAPLPPGD